MIRLMCKSKIHRATVTQTEVDYVGSLTLDADLMKAAGLAPYEQVQVLNLANGSRLTTYLIEGAAGSGMVCLNGPAALLAVPGDLIIVLAYGLLEERELSGFHPRLVFVDSKNRPVKGPAREKPGMAWKPGKGRSPRKGRAGK